MNEKHETKTLTLTLYSPEFIAQKQTEGNEYWKNAKPGWWISVHDFISYSKFAYLPDENATKEEDDYAALIMGNLIISYAHDMVYDLNYIEDDKK